MSFSSYSALVADCLPLKKRDQRPGSPAQHPQCDSALFKVPYPYKRHTGPFQPVPRRVLPLYQPWMQPSSRIKPHFLSAFRDYRNWPEWNNVQSQWSLSHLHQQHPLLSGPTPYTQPTSTARQVSLGTPVLYNDSVCERRLQHTDMTTETDGRSKGPYMKRKDRRRDSSTAENTSLSSLSVHPPNSGDLEFKHHQLDKPMKHHQHPILKVPSSENPRERSAKVTPPPSAQSSSLNPVPWLLPHFEAGSLIELRDGRLRRVEHLQTEDFLLGSLACPDLRLSCCTVQRISPSTQTTSISRLLILLHEQHSQELVDVYEEYPFFVRDRGWSSCSPQRTARLCGLQCRQLSVGDVCLALTPVSAPRPPALVPPEPSPPSSRTGLCGLSLLPPGTREKVGGRRRHSSAPQLRSQTDRLHSNI